MIGVLALQGAFLEHLAKFEELGVPCKEVRSPDDLVGCDGLVIPGGESTAMTLIAQRLGMWEPLKAWVAGGRPTWGTCAGMIMMSEEVVGGKAGGQALLGGLHVRVHRNYFGSQRNSFEAHVDVDPAVKDAVTHDRPDGRAIGVFIRAPAITAILRPADPSSAGATGTDSAGGVVPLAWVRMPHRDAQVPELPATTATAAPVTDSAGRTCVAVRQGAFLATAFHPELTTSAGWHRLFASMVDEVAGGRSHTDGIASSMSVSSTPAPPATAASPTDRPDDGGGAVLECTPGTTAASSYRWSGAGAGAGAGAVPTPFALHHTVKASWAGVAPLAASPLGVADGAASRVGGLEAVVNVVTGGNAASHAIAHRVLPPITTL